jgi:MSHA biogenesis protein MshN
MSLINQMLQDLEQRKVNEGATAAQIRAVGKPGKWSAGSWGWLFFVLLAVAAGTAFWIFGVPAEKAMQPTPSPAIVSVQPVATPEPATQIEETPSVMQLASELSFMPSYPPAGKEIKVAPPAELTPAKQEVLPPPVVEKPLPIVAEIKKPAVAVEPIQPADISKEIRQLNPHQRAENLYRQAYASLQQGRMGEAEESLRQALQLEPRHAAARQALAALLVESRHLDRAEQLLRQGLELLPGNTGYVMMLARIQVERGDVATALATLQRNAPASENAEYHGFLAALLQRSERHKEAIDHYLAALRTNSTAGSWLLGLGISLQADGQAGKAAEIFRRARQSGSLSPELQAFAEQRLKQLQ